MWPSSDLSRGTPARLLMAALLSVGIAACKKDAAPPARPKRAKPAVAQRSTAHRHLKLQCKQVAVSSRGKQSKAEEGLLDMPPRADDETVSDATRRLAALEAIDLLTGRLKNDPKHAELYYQLGWIYRWSLGNDEAAVSHLCRALLLAPANERYRMAVLSTWMQAGQEQQLELALRPGERNLPWRAALVTARALTGTDWEERAQFFESAVAAQRVLRNNRLMKRRRARGMIEDIAALLDGWVAEGLSPGATDDVRIVVSFPRRWRRKVANLSRRERQDVPDAVFQVEGPGPRWLVFGQGREALTSVLDYAAAALPGRRLGVSLRHGVRRLYLIGKLDAGGFKLELMAQSPDSTAIGELDLAR